MGDLGDLRVLEDDFSFLAVRLVSVVFLGVLGSFVILSMSDSELNIAEPSSYSSLESLRDSLERIVLGVISDLAESAFLRGESKLRRGEDEVDSMSTPFPMR